MLSEFCANTHQTLSPPDAQLDAWSSYKTTMGASVCLTLTRDDKHLQHRPLV